MEVYRKWLVVFNAGRTQLFFFFFFFFFFDWSNNNGAIDVKMDGLVLEDKSSSKILG